MEDLNIHFAHSQIPANTYFEKHPTGSAEIKEEGEVLISELQNNLAKYEQYDSENNKD